MHVNNQNNQINFQSRIQLKRGSGLYNNFMNNPHARKYLSLEEQHQLNVGIASYSAGGTLLGAAATGSLESTVAEVISTPSTASSGMALFPFGYASVLRGIRNLEIFANKKTIVSCKNIPD